MNMRPTLQVRTRTSLYLAFSRRACKNQLRRELASRQVPVQTTRSLGVWASLQPWSALTGTKETDSERKQSEVQPQAGLNAMEQSIQEVYENQRYYGIAWRAPPALDRAGWTDPAGKAVQLTKPPTEDAGQWQPVITPGTDDEGWQYGTVFNHLDYKRSGGRSSQRFGDMVRRRLWRRKAPQQQPCVQKVAGGRDEVCLRAAVTAPLRGGLDSAGPKADASAALAGAAGAELTGERSSSGEGRSSLSAYEAEAKKRAMKAFTGLVLDLLQRRRLWTIIPWDPSALLVLYRKHQEVYQQLQAQAYERRLFTADQAAPPSPLRPDQRTMLQDMLCAAMHARAAYGYPMAAGHVSSVMSYVKLQTVQQLSFDAVGGVSVEANNEAVAALAGIDADDILMSQWKNSTYRPCHYVAIDRANQCVVLSIRGSLQVGDLLSDLSAHPMEVSLAGVEEGGWVHQGIFAAATYIHCNTQAALEEAAQKCPGWPVLVTGHSLGGGTAALVAMLMHQAGLPRGLGPLHCITIGTAAVVSENIAAACQEYITSLIVGSDVIPHLSYASVEALLMESSQASPVRQAAERAVGTLTSAGKTITQAGAAVVEALGTIPSLPEALSPLKASLPDALTNLTSLTALPQNASSPSLAGWKPLREAAPGKSASTGGLSKILPVLDDEGAARAHAAHAAQQAARSAEQQQGQQREEKDEEGAEGSKKRARPAPKMIPVIDLSQGGAGVISEVPGPQQAQQRRKQLGAGATSSGVAEPYEPLLPYGAGVDMPLLGAAMAQEEASGHAPDGEGAQAEGRQPPASADPELLYPPGRLYWIFPSDEDLSTLSGGDAAAVAAGVVAGAVKAELGGEAAAAAAGGSSAEAVGPAGAGDQELEADEGAEFSVAQGEGVAGDGRQHEQQPQPEGEEQGQPAAQPKQAQQDRLPRVPQASLDRLRHESERATARMAAKEAQHVQRGVQAPPEGAGAGAAVDIDEAMEEVEAGEGQQVKEGSVPVVVEADRRSFERILLMPDMMNDHLPDRYLAAIQQL